MLKKVIIGVMILVVLGLGGVFLLDQTIFAAAPVSTALPAAPTLDLSAARVEPTLASTEPIIEQFESHTEQTSQPETAGATEIESSPQAGEPSDQLGPRLYRIDPQHSEVRYEVGETFFQDNRFATAVGRTTGIAGELLVDYDQPAASRVGEIVIDVSQFVSDESRRDNFLNRNGLVSSVYPFASFITHSIEGLPARAAPGEKFALTLHGDLTVKEVTKPASWQLVLELFDGQIIGSAETQILMSDYGVGPIQLAFLRTEDEVKLVFEFVAVEVATP